MKLKTKLLAISSFVIMMSLNTQQIVAQSVDYKNKLEFSDDLVTDDLNAIKLVSSSRVVSKHETVVKKTTKSTKLDELLEKNKLRFRNKRRTNIGSENDKCYKESDVHCTD